MMKKITLLLLLLAVSFGYSQTPIEDFEAALPGGALVYSDELDDAPDVLNGSVTVVADPAAGPNGQVLEIITTDAGNSWQNAQLFLQGNLIDLSTANKVVSVEVYSTVAFEMLAKVVDGPGGLATESATDASYTTPNQWQTLNFDFNVNKDGSAVASEVYSRILFFPLWGAAGWKPNTVTTTYVDNIVLSYTLGLEDKEITEFRTYPNPTKDSWTIKTKNQAMSSIQVFDILGKNVLSLTPNTSEAKIDASRLTTGLYFAQIKTASGIASIKLVKQ